MRDRDVPALEGANAHDTGTVTIELLDASSLSQFTH